METILYMHNTVDKITEYSFQTRMSFSYNERYTRYRYGNIYRV
jgi:hypothetical protein